MGSLLKISDAAAIGIHSIAVFALNPNEVLTVGAIAEKLKVSEAHLSKVLQRLTKAGILESTRGPKGGFKLNETENEINLLNVYEAIEGSIDSSNCILNKNKCSATSCVMGDLVHKLSRDIKEYLSTMKISDLKSIYTSNSHN